MSRALAELLRVFTDQYDTLKHQLTYRLGSSELASDVLHDTYVKLSDKLRESDTPVRSPKAFLVRTALNLAIDRIRYESRLLSGDEVEQLLAPDDQGADSANGALAQVELERLAHVMNKLPSRRRELLFASRVEGIPQRELAKRYGISLRLVELEIRRAHDFCVEQMRKEKDG